VNGEKRQAISITASCSIDVIASRCRRSVCHSRTGLSMAQDGEIWRDNAALRKGKQRANDRRRAQAKRK